MDAESVKTEMFEYAINHTSGLSDADKDALKQVWDNRRLRMLICDFNYTGEYPRASRQLGYDCKLFDAEGNKKHKNSKGTQWRLVERGQGQEFPDHIPARAREVWANTKSCNHCGHALEGHFEVDHRLGRAHFGNLDLTPDSSIELIREKTQPLCVRCNSKKREACQKCQNTKVRPSSSDCIKFWFQGSQRFDEAIGCDGCYFAYPEKWRDAIAARLVATRPGDGT